MPSSVSAVISSTSGTRRPVDHQRVVAGGLERLGQAGEHAGAVVADQRRLAVHDLRGPHDLAAEDLADALVAEAHAEDGTAGRRSARMTSLDTPASSGVPGPGEISTASGSRATISATSARRGGARAARRRARPGTGRGCRRTSRSCRSPARGGSHREATVALRCSLTTRSIRVVEARLQQPCRAWRRAPRGHMSSPSAE